MPNNYDGYVAMLNAIRNEASTRYSNAIPSADGTVENLKTIGALLTSNQAFANEWLDALYNRIAITRVITMDGWRNPLREFKRKLEYGESYLEVAMHLAGIHERDYSYAKSHLFDINTPAVDSAIYHVNSEFFYPTSVLPAELKKAFLSYEALSSFVETIINNIYRTMEYDEYNAMLYVVARAILSGAMTGVEIPAVSAANAREIISKIKAVSNEMEFLNKKYTTGEMESYAAKSDQFLFMNSLFDATVDTSVLAVSFNMNMAEFMGVRRLFNTFADLDTDRLDVLFKNDPLYETLDSGDLAELGEIPAFLISRDWFVCFDEYTEMFNNENGMGPYRNYFLHCGRIYSYSNFQKAAYFVPGTQSVTSVTVSPSTAEMIKNDVKTFKATVVTANLADPRVVWSVPTEDEDKIQLDYIDGQTVSVRLLANLGAATITLTATSVFDNTKTGTATISAPA